MTEKLTAEQIRKNRRIVAITACVLAVAIPLLMLVYNQFLAPGPYELVCREFSNHGSAYQTPRQPSRLILEKDIENGITMVLYETQNSNVFDCRLVVKKLFKTEIRHWNQGGLLNPIFENRKDDLSTPYIRIGDNASRYFIPENPSLFVGVTGKKLSAVYYGMQECEFITDPETGSTLYWFMTEDDTVDTGAIAFNEPSGYGIVRDKMIYDTEDPATTRFAPEYLIFEEAVDPSYRFVFYKTLTGSYAGVIVSKGDEPSIQTGSNGIFHPGYIGTNIDGKFTYVRNIYPIGDDQYFVAEITNQSPTSASFADIPATVAYTGNSSYLCYCLVPKSAYTGDTAFEYTYAK